LIRFKRDGFDPLSMALAFGSHVYADVVGFHTPYGGYLSHHALVALLWPLAQHSRLQISHA
jgi:hypothetical protein